MNASFEPSKARLIRGAARLVASIAIATSFSSQTISAQNATPDVTPEQIRKLEESIRLLQEQNRQLQGRVEELEGKKTKPSPQPTAPKVLSSSQIASNLPPAKADNEVKIYWKNGLSFQSKDGDFKSTLGGRVDLDAASFSEDDELRTTPGIGDIPAGTEFRRARLSLEGEYRSSVPAFYKVELDFAEADVAFKDVLLGLSELPFVGKIQAGHFKEPSSLEGLTSSRFLTFIERAAPVEAFWPERNTGFMITRTLFEDRASFALGGFTSTELRDGVDGGQPLDSDYRVVGRITGLPIYDAQSKGARLLHLGLSGTLVNPEGDLVRFRSRPEAHMAPRFVDTGSFAADNQYMLAAEAAFVCGPFSLQSEYFYNWLDQIGASTAEFDGYYVYGSWFITGEHRAYKFSSGTFDRLIPKNNLSFENGGLGAWELAARFSHLDLNDAAVSGGRLDDITGGLNWYLNPNMKIQFNYVYSMLDRIVAGIDREGDAHIFETRLHVDF